MSKNKHEFYAEFENGTSIKIEIPNSWRITVGALHPGKSVAPLALRVYNGNKIRALYPKIKMVSDSSIKITGDISQITMEQHMNWGSPMNYNNQQEFPSSTSQL